MKIEEIEIEGKNSSELLQLFKNKGYKYIWIQKVDRVEICELDKNDFDIKKLMEARIFGDGREIHVFEYDSGLKAVECCTEATDIAVDKFSDIPQDSSVHYFDEDQILPEKYGEKLTFRNFIAYEDDGQAYIGNKILLKFE